MVDLPIKDCDFHSYVSVPEDLKHHPKIVIFASETKPVVGRTPMLKNKQSTVFDAQKFKCRKNT